MLTAQAWFEHDGQSEGWRPLVSQWETQSAMTGFSAYDAGMTGGMDTTGFFGAVFDGRYVYFVAQHDQVTRSGKFLRYDTHGEFKDAHSWSVYDASRTEGLLTRGFYGAVFDGRYVFFCPRHDGSALHSRALRYDTHGGFTDPANWSAYDVGLPQSSQSAAYDGRYIYFCPGQELRPRVDPKQGDTDGSPKITGTPPELVAVAAGKIIRHDTQGEFKASRSWVVFDASKVDDLDTRDFDGAVFDGRYVYFMPLSFGAVLRYDTRGDFQQRDSWAAFNAGALGVVRCVGAIFDGRYVYPVPYGDTEVAARYDTTRDFYAAESWQSYPIKETVGLSVQGYDGAAFDGRYVYYIPFWDPNPAIGFHGVLLRYDTQGDFTDPSAWSAADGGMVDGLLTTGFNAGAFDGRFLYCAPWRDGHAPAGTMVGHGRVLRYDTADGRGCFRLMACDLGHNGGLCAALPGPSFMVNTTRGPISIAAHRPLSAGRHHLAGVYDGETLSLYIDGELAASRAAYRQELVQHATPVQIAPGVDGEVMTEARDAQWVRAQFRARRT